jgi:hypothetical protein
MLVHDVLLSLDKVGDFRLGNLSVKLVVDEGKRSDKVSILKQVDKWFSIG